MTFWCDKNKNASDTNARQTVHKKGALLRICVSTISLRYLDRKSTARSSKDVSYKLTIELVVFHFIVNEAGVVLVAVVVHGVASTVGCVT